MLTLTVEKNIARLIYLGVPFATILVITNMVSDPVNVTKLLVIGVLAFAILFLLIFKSTRETYLSLKAFTSVLILIFLTLLWSSLNSDSPVQQNIYGAFGRNTGLLAYFAMGLIALGAAVISQLNNLRKIMYGFAAAGIVNIVYCFIAWQFKDPINWSNPYGAILGTFGNPNFISSFLGMVITAFCSYALQKGIGLSVRLALGTLSLLAFSEILSSRSIQGIAVTAFGLAITIFLKIRSLNFKTKNISKFILILYSGIVILAGTFALMGALQKGPLAQYIYKTSVSLRGEYWRAGINMALLKPFTGVGLDSFGDWYRRARDAQALIVPGPNTVSNAAHNVPIDFLASGGFPLFIAYLSFVMLGLIAIVKVVRRKKEFDWLFVAITGVWLDYHLQSIISINQIGIAIWGWLLTGCLISYERITRDSATTQPNVQSVTTKQKLTRTKEKNQFFSPSLIAGIGAVVGALIFIPPFNADVQWRSGMVKGNSAQIRKALTSTYMTPSDSMRLIQSVEILEQNKFYDEAYFYAKQAVKLNPQSFDSWKVLMSVSKSTEADKKYALSQLQILDPKNKELFATK